ncbi:MAG: alginate lyase family protein [Opitutae bacterium]|nr:alginate lyase family protein [Opitutae bacterium]
MFLLPDFDLHACERPRIEHIAPAALATTPKTIVAVVNPRSAGGPHDFSSEGDYWWPDPKNPDGPYIQRDGLSNPDNFVAHRQLLIGFARDFSTLAAAYRVTREERYATAGARHLRAWFVDPATRMNPSLLYSQAIKGRSTGRSIGVIDTLHLVEVALGVEALRGAKAFSTADDTAVTAWFRDYLHWLRTHPYGVDESKAENNHGTCWALQAAAFAHVTGDAAGLADCRRRFKEILLPRQMAADGSFPRELARTKPYGYSIFNLDVMTALAQLLSTPEENLLTWTLPDGRSIAKGIAYLAPFLADKTKWPGKRDVMYWDDWPVRQPALIFGALATGNTDWLATWRKLNPDPSVEEIQRNFPIRQPVLWMR